MTMKERLGASLQQNGFKHKGNFPIRSCPEKNFLEWNQPLDRNDRAIQYKNVRIRVATLATHLAVKFLAP
jgi:hypothetical protein